MKVEIFRGIRYAWAERFGPAHLMPFDAVSREGERGPVSPQVASRLEFVMGPAMPLRQSEHCQVLSIFSPARSSKRPVMVFLHGGAFVTGGGELPWYDGDKLAGEQDLVVVTVTYRLGALGYLHFPGGTGPSPGMSDQIAALEWVKANIAAFGGDPGKVTVFGQSAGGMSIACMLTWGYGNTLFSRAIVQSSPAGLNRTRAAAERISQEFVEFAGRDPRSMSAEGLLAAQDRFAQGRRESQDWAPVAPDVPPTSYVNLLTGWTRDDALPFVLMGAGIKPGRDTDIGALMPQVNKINPMFEYGCRQIAAEAVKAGRKAWLYRFDWAASESGLGASHCVDLPFLLGDFEAWRSAPVLGNEPWEKIEAVGKTMRMAWANFARAGAPDFEMEQMTASAYPLHFLSP